jgi:hypothetical protein
MLDLAPNETPSVRKNRRALPHAANSAQCFNGIFSPSGTLHAALVYRSLGFSPIPFHPRSKKPAFDKGEIHKYRQRPAPSDTLRWDPKTGTLKYHDWHRQSGHEWYQLADVFASIAYGEVVRLRGPEMAVWQLRMLVEAKLIAPYRLSALDLPTNTTAHVKRVYHGFLWLLACKWLYTPEAPTPFTWRFAAAWCGKRSMRQVGEAMAWLLQHGYLRQVGRHGRMALFLPGGAR